MRRIGRYGLVAATAVAVLAVPAAWVVTRSEPTAAAAGPESVSATAPDLRSWTVAPPGVVSPPTPSAAPTPSASPAATARRATPHAVAATKAAARPATTVRKAPFRFPVPVSLGNARQVVTVKARGSYATVQAWQLSGGSWHQVISTTAARVGTHGVVPGSRRKQGTGTTPGGTYTLTEAFGIAANPGSRMPYHAVTSDDWWVEDNTSKYYNQMRRGSLGGFNEVAPPNSVNGSEHLITYTVQYRYVVVIDFNRWPAVPYRGAGIFLHVNGTGSTAGCVSVPASTMVAILRWLDPAQHPRIAIA